MLILTRKIGERLMIGDDIIVTVLDVNRKSGAVSIGIDAPKDVEVDREEIRIRKENDRYDDR